MKAQLINCCRSQRLPRRFLNQWIKSLAAALQYEKLKPGQLMLTVVFVDPAKMKTLNRQFRGHDYATDVLSFAPEEPNSLGELVLCPQVLRKQAKTTGLSYRQELGFMIIHGCLHLLGFDHETQSEKTRMFKLQDRLMRRIRSD